MVSLLVPLFTSTLLGGAGSENISGGIEGGNDTIYGDAEAEESLAGNDVINGGNGDDFIDGGAGVDRVIGGAGVDLLYGGEDPETQSARDTLTGGAGTDFFQLNYAEFVPEPIEPGEPIVPVPPGDYITDFTNGTDYLFIEGLEFEDLGFRNFTLGGVSGTEIYVLTEGFTPAQSEKLAFVAGVNRGAFDASDFIEPAI
jgi:Ca2+-binding RTX toxin-like protein